MAGGAQVRLVPARDHDFAVLIGDRRQQGRYLGLPILVMIVAASVGFWLEAPEIIRFSNGTTSFRQRSTTAFVPQLHDVCLERLSIGSSRA